MLTHELVWPPYTNEPHTQTGKICKFVEVLRIAQIAKHNKAVCYMSTDIVSANDQQKCAF